jgi:hypothetical protein
VFRLPVGRIDEARATIAQRDRQQPHSLMSSCFTSATSAAHTGIGARSAVVASWAAGVAAVA